MRRRAASEEDDVSLFPFLSILACVIGSLTLMITALALGEMDNETVASAEKYEAVKRQLEADRLRIAELRKRLEAAPVAARDLRQQLAAARAELARLQAAVASGIQDNTQPTEVLAVDTKAQEKQMTQLQQQLAEVQKKIKALLAELRKRDVPPPEAVVTIRPGGSGVDLTPTFVECTASALVMYDRPQPQRVLRGKVTTDKEFLGLLDKVAQQPKASVIFLVRSDGVGTYRVAKQVARTHYARNGKLPVIGKGKIDLSMFQKK